MIEKIIHIIVPARLSALQAEVIDLAERLHPDWEIIVWRDPIARNGFLLEDYWNKANSGAQFADLLRLDALYRFGGVYIDSDVRLIKPLDELARTFDFFIASEDGNHPTNAVMGARRGSPVIKALIDALIDTEPDWQLPPNLTTGPQFFSDHLRWRMDVAVLPRETFFSYSWSEAKKRCHRHSFGEHLWIGSWVTPDAAKKGGHKHVLSGHRAGLGVAANAAFSDSFHLSGSIVNWADKTFAAVKQLLKDTIILAFRTRNRLRSLDPAPSVQCGASPNKYFSCNEEIVVQSVHGFNIYVDGRDTNVTPSLVFNGCYELAEEKFFKSVLRGGDWVIDVGAGVGSFTLLAANCVGPFGRVYAYEPNRRPFSLLSRSLVMNRMEERVIQRQVAVREEEGSIPCFWLDQQLRDDQNAHQNANIHGENHLTQSQIRVVRLDDEFPVNVPIKILRADVEGGVDVVLKGAKRLIHQRCIDYIMIELRREVASPRWIKVAAEIKSVLGHQYTASVLSEEGSLIEQKDIYEAVRNMRGRTIVLAAADHELTR